MDFKVTKQQAIEAAAAADNFNDYITEPGAYVIKITKAILKQLTSGASFFEITGSTSEGKVGTVSILTKTKEGKSTYLDKRTNTERQLPGINSIQGSLMPCLGVGAINSVVKDDVVTYPGLIGKELGILTNIRITNNKKGGTFKNLDLVTFFEAKSGRCGSEIVNGISESEAKRKNEIEKTLKIIDETNKGPIVNQVMFGASNSDPFNESVGDSSSNQDEQQYDSKTSEVEEAEGNFFG